ncbi:hypothetical protein VBJ55_22555 [Enterobacter hormaechei]|nr:hypothetical protein [Enterobacter hormaechei]
MTKLTPEAMEQLTTEQLLDNLSNLNKWMAKAKEDQELLRRTIKSRLERDMIISKGKEGTQTTDFSLHGVPGKLKVEQKINRSLEQKLVPEVMKKLPKVVAAKLFKAKYDMSITAYRNLTPEQLAIVGPIVKVSPGIPTVTFTAAETDDAE